MQMRYINKGILFIAIVLSFLQGTKLYAQQTLIDVSIDSAAILIGEQTVLHLTITTDNGKNVIVPINIAIDAARNPHLNAWISLIPSTLFTSPKIGQIN